MFLLRKLPAVVAISLLSSIALAQDKPQKKEPDDILQHKNGAILVGKITKVTDTGVEMQLKGGGNVSLEFKVLVPYSVYRVKADRIDQKSAQAHYDLGDYCLAQGNGFYGFAWAEFDKALAIDPELADAKKKREDAFNEDARTKFEEAKRLIAEKDYEGAEKLLSALLTNYRETPWAKEAQTEMAQVAEEIRRENELKKKQLDDKQAEKKAKEVKKTSEDEKGLIQQVMDAIDEAKKSWGEGLDWESKMNVSKADRAFKNAEDRLLSAKRIVGEKLLKSSDAAIAAQAKDLDKDIDAWLVRTYYRLGRLWGTIERNYTEATTWLNRGLKISPDDPLCNGLLLTISQAVISGRAK